MAPQGAEVGLASCKTRWKHGTENSKQLVSLELFQGKVEHSMTVVPKNLVLTSLLICFVYGKGYESQFGT